METSGVSPDSVPDASQKPHEAWISLEEIKGEMEKRGWEYIGKGPRDNATDGEIDLIFGKGKRKRRLQGNIWDRTTIVYPKVATEAQREALKRGQDDPRYGSIQDERAYVPAPEGASESYAAMWHVAKNGPKWDRTYEHERLRAFLEAKPDQLQSQLTGLEKEHRMSVKAEAVVVKKKDEGSERALKLINDLLAKFPK